MLTCGDSWATQTATRFKSYTVAFEAVRAQNRKPIDRRHSRILTRGVIPTSASTIISIPVDTIILILIHRYLKGEHLSEHKNSLHIFFIIG